MLDMLNYLKFFQSDVIQGTAKYTGDVFFAEFFGGVAKFSVVEIVDADMFYAKLED